MQTLVTVEDLYLSYPLASGIRVMVLRGVSFTAGRSGLLALVGPSGSGKTSLIRVLLGLKEPDAGLVRVLGMIPWEEHKKVRRNIGYLSQEGLLVPWLSIWENIMLYLVGRGKSVEGRRDRIMEYARVLDIEKVIHKKPPQLSGGEQRRAELLLALSDDNPIYVLDEPTAMVDRERASSIIKLLKSISEERLVITATHDPWLVDAADITVDLGSYAHR
ncbi:MAG: ABC transporter ATP-binding protein [Desulfurococcales archaeon]|nr:ABC transporter ATP-binding protein [Desulfurococcales archaeon]